MILRFPYLDEPLQGSPPPSLPVSAPVRWRPLVPVIVHGPLGPVAFGRALLDPGSDDTILPLHVATVLGVTLLPQTGHGMRWRGQRLPLRFGSVEIELVDDAGTSIRWPAIVGFSTAAFKYPLLGMCGCLEFLDVKFLGSDRAVEVEPNAALPLVQVP